MRWRGTISRAKFKGKKQITKYITVNDFPYNGWKITLDNGNLFGTYRWKYEAIEDAKAFDIILERKNDKK